MSKEEKIDKILEMTKEIMILMINELKEESLNELYVNTKIMLEARKELEGGESDEVEK